MREAAIFIGIPIAAVVGLTAILVALGGWGNEVGCRNKAELMGVPYSYSISTDCMVNWHGQWLPLRSIYKVN
jgi:hypothetical protein